MAPQRRLANAEQHNNTTTQQHNNTTTQQHNNTTTQQQLCNILTALLYGLVAVTAVTMSSCQESGEPNDISNYQEDTSLIGPEGGVLVYENQFGNQIKIEIPPNAVSERVNFTIKEFNERIPGSLGPAFDLGPSGIQFKKPVRIFFSYKDKRKSPIKPKPIIASKSGHKWAALGDIQVSENEISGTTEHFSLFVVSADPSQFSVVSNELGTNFNIGDVQLQSSQEIRLISGILNPISVRYTIESVDQNITNTSITLKGLRPETQVFIYDGSHTRETIAWSDVHGNLTYQQDLSDGVHTVWLQEEHGTVIISADNPDDPSGCRKIGEWSEDKRTCFVGSSGMTVIQEQIEIVTDDTKLSCASNFRQSKIEIVSLKSGPAVTIAPGVKGASVEHCEIIADDSAILLAPFSGHSTINNNNLTSNMSIAVQVAFSGHILAPGQILVFQDDISVNFSKNVILDGQMGILIDESPLGTYKNNEIFSHRGFLLESAPAGFPPYKSRGNIIEDNIISHTNASITSGVIYGIRMDDAPGNIISKNLIHTVEMETSAVGIWLAGDSGFGQITKNTIKGFLVGILIDENIGLTINFNQLIYNNIALLLGSLLEPIPNTPDQGFLKLFMNDIYKNGTPQVVSHYKFALNSDQGQGNYWGYQCVKTLFIPGIDAALDGQERSMVFDNFPFAYPVAVSEDDSILPNCNPDPDVDTDGDGFTDREELFGMTFTKADLGSETPGLVDGQIYSLNLAELGASPVIKDVFIEVDYIEAESSPNLETVSAIRKIINIFKNNKINLHVDLGNFASENLNAPDLDLGQGNSSILPSSPSIQYNENTAKNVLISNFDPNRYKAFRYSFLAERTLLGSRSVAWGRVIVFASIHSGEIDSQAATFMHELGHTLGLGHGGGDEVNFKPNYQSIMNYLFSGSHSGNMACSGGPAGIPLFERSSSEQLINGVFIMDYSGENLPAICEGFDPNASEERQCLSQTLIDINNFEFTSLGSLTNKDTFFSCDFGTEIKPLIGSRRRSAVGRGEGNNSINWLCGIRECSDDIFDRGHCCIDRNDLNLLACDINYDICGSEKMRIDDNGVPVTVDQATLDIYNYSLLTGFNDWENLNFLYGVTGAGGDWFGFNFPIYEGVIPFPHISQFIEIDIKPSSENNPINLKSRGVIPIAILSSVKFDATQIQVNSLRFGLRGTEAPAQRCHVLDTNDDDLLDFLCHFETSPQMLLPSSTTGIIRGTTVNGLKIGGIDTVTIVP